MEVSPDEFEKGTLGAWVPEEFFDEFMDTRAAKYLDVEVVEDHGLGAKGGHKYWPGKEKNVYNWCILANGLAVGWNENPARGWSFPVIKYKG